jgi:aspartate aminotransferase-like enzyme
MQLRIPGPTPCPPEVLQAGAKQMVNHRGVEFKDLIFRTTENLKKVYQTNKDLLILTCSGTGGLEAAIVNFLSPEDKVLSVSIGVFGERFADIARTYGVNVIQLKFEYGQAADPDKVRKALQDNPDVKAVMVTHNETSTGTTNDIAALSKVVKEFDKLILVDSISGMASLDIPVDKLDLDVVVGGSQKGWMIPPGLSFVSVSEKAWKANEVAKIPRFYMDLAKAKKFLVNGETPWTPAVGIFFGLDAALDLMLKEGLPNIFARHAAIGQFVRNEVKKRGLEILPDDQHASNTVTAVKAGDKIDAPKLQKVLREQYQVVLAGGQKDLKGKIFRIGHLGYVSEKDMKEVFEAMDKALPQAAK